ncbi:MAG: hypothetical protein K6A23_11390 [Butyrivibrio sp.]|nr:hypothetical protein [Butyrivibrio sp.]
MGSRKANSAKNLISSIVNQFVTLLFSFVTRTIFIHYLGVEYLGINGLYSNILQVLSLADLGFGSAITYSMYKPIKNNDIKVLSALITFYGTIYKYVAIGVSVVGIILIPFLPYIVNSTLEYKYVVLYYVLYLCNVVVSYLFVYKTSITKAYQKAYILNQYDTTFIVIKNILQILVMVLFKSFVGYLLVQIIIGWGSNLYKTIQTEKMFPFIKEKEVLGKAEKISILDNVKSMFLYRIGGVIMSNTDNILISMLVGTIYVGFYSNYLLVVNSVLNFMNLFFYSITASLGDLNAGDDTEKSYLYFNRVNFVANSIAVFCSVCFWGLLEDFVTIWLGGEYLLDELTLVAIVLNFFMPMSIRTVSLYRDTMGMFKKTKYVFCFTAAINLILSVILGKLLGLSGILIASAIARALTNIWYEPMILFKDYFHKDIFKNYVVKQLKYWIIFLCACAICSFIRPLFGEITIFKFIIEMFIIAFVPMIIIVLAYYRSDEFNYFVDIFKGTILTKIKKSSK